MTRKLDKQSGMGNCCRKRKSKEPISLLLLGLDGVGKTRFAHKVCRLTRHDFSSTQGCKSYETDFHGFSLQLSELGGGVAIRDIWRHYYVDTFGVVFLVDSADVDRLAEAKGILEALLAHPELQGKPFLILATKQDVDGAVDYLDLCEFLEIERLANQTETPCFFEAIGEEETYEKDVERTLDWMVQIVDKNFKRIRNRIEFQQKFEEGGRKRKMSRACTAEERKKRSKVDRPRTAPIKWVPSGWKPPKVSSFYVGPKAVSPPPPSPRPPLPPRPPTPPPIRLTNNRVRQMPSLESSSDTGEAGQMSSILTEALVHRTEDGELATSIYFQRSAGTNRDIFNNPIKLNVPNSDDSIVVEDLSLMDSLQLNGTAEPASPIANGNITAI